MDPLTIERVLSCKRLPSLPAVALRVIELTQAKDVRTRELADTITNDQALAGKVLRTVNSSFYALRKPCSSISQAIVLLGLSAVKTLALGFSLAGAIPRKGEDGFDYPGYWRRGLLSGVAGKCIAVEARCGNDEECFLGGLLQDVGMVAMSQALEGEYAAVLAKAGADHRQLAKFEVADLEVSHPEIGAMLVTRWKLPPELVMPVRFHERPSAAPSEYLRICQAVALGNIVCEVMQAAEPGIALKRFYTRAQEWMGLSTAQCDAIIKKTEEGAKEVARLLDVDPGALPVTGDLLDRAQAQMSRISLPFTSAETGTTDPATGLGDRLAFNQNLAVAFELTSPGEVFSLAMMAIDNPASLATLNPLVAQGIVACVANKLAAHFQSQGAGVFRFDESRFAVLMFKCERLHAARLVEEARAQLAQAPVVVHPAGLMPTTMDVTLSAGVACVEPATRGRLADPDALVDTTLRALAAAQSNGTNAMRVFTPKAAA